MRITAFCCGLLLASVASAAPSFVLQNMHPGPEYAYSEMAATAGGRVRVGAVLKSNDSYWQGALWLDGSREFRNLTPPGFDGSWGYAVRNGQIAGYANLGFTAAHAAIWSDDGENFVDLNPLICLFSDAYGTDGTQQVGEGYVRGLNQSHAILWSGTAESVVDLNPQSATRSTARAVANGQQVGSASDFTAFEHAFLWRGTAESALDLNPPGAMFSQIASTDGIHQAGSASWDGDHTHAVLWSGTADSAIDLHPAGFVSSGLLGNFGEWQVGWGSLPDGTSHALLWMGTADSVIDLQQFVPAEFTSSIAYGIDGVDGTIVGTMWYENGGNVDRAVMWTVPEPASLALLATSFVGSLRRRQV